MAVKQTAGRDALGEFAPKFAQLNDDVLFGEVWSREDKLSLRDRSLVTVVALMAQGLVDSSFQYHLSTAKQNGITREEIAEILTHAAFTLDGPRPVLPSAWPRRSGARRPEKTARHSINRRWSSPLEHPMTVLPSILWDRATSTLSPPARWACTM